MWTAGRQVDQSIESRHRGGAPLEVLSTTRHTDAEQSVSVASASGQQTHATQDSEGC